MKKKKKKKEKRNVKIKWLTSKEKKKMFSKFTIISHSQRRNMSLQIKQL